MQDSTNTRLRPLLSLVAGAAALFFTASANANLINPDFSSGFAGWSATLDFAPAAPTGPEFTLPGGGLAKLSTSASFFDVALFQQFILPGDAGTFALDFDWMITAPSDFVQISLRDIVTNTDFDLLFIAGFDPTAPTGAGRLELDISALAGREVELLAFVQDADFGDDMLSFGNVAIAPQPPANTVSAPASLLLVSLGAVLLGFRGRASS